METIKSLVLTIHIFSEFNCAGEFEQQAEGVLNHSLKIAALRQKNRHAGTKRNAAHRGMFHGGFAARRGAGGLDGLICPNNTSR